MLDYVLFFTVILLAVIFAKRYNFIHGFISFFAFAAICVGLGVLMEKVDSLASFMNTYRPMSDLVKSSIETNLRDFMLELFSKEIPDWVYYCSVIGLFVISQVCSSMLRRSRKRRFNPNPKYRRV